ncbi:uncharacterized protein LOC125370432 [Ricinus communis]|uniref:Uncharacterized protein n=1 Tax=Ricinus communis TaxID=3988 RepID=B9SUQ1_RICCO|nr:uncharacterized protein LOC125370432 [Ricinus communis]EEF32686.1 conserved hypothetical protein [Ricinus communis]
MDEEFEDSLSLCDLPLHQETETNTFPDQELPNCPSNQDLFEFSLTPNSKIDPTLHNVIFCGKNMSCKMEEPTNALYDEGNSLFPSNSTQLLSKSCRSNSFHMQTLKPSPPTRLTRSFRYQSGNSRKHKFMIGLARIPPEMELSDIRKRQRRQAPISMFPAKVPSDETPVATSNEGDRKVNQCLLKPLKCRSYLKRGLSKVHLGCMQLK